MDEGPRQAFGDLLRQYRVKAGLTQEELAEQAELSTKAISMLECGVTRTPHRDTVAVLAAALRLTDLEHAELGAAVRRRRGPPAHGGPAAYPPLPASLLIPPTPLIGRDDEIAAIQQLLIGARVRLLTLTGPPGVGKTRLAIEVAARLRAAFDDGAIVAALAPLRDPALVLSTIAQAVGLHESGTQPLLHSLVEALRDRGTLLLLDNFEHVPAAAPLLMELLAACPRLQVLLTSRVELRVRGEQIVSVQPLALPVTARSSQEELAGCAAIDLFVQRARAVQPDFALTATNAPLVAAICERLDGLPLAIELAAARVRLLPPRALLARLTNRLQVLTDGPHDLPERQQTMRGAIAWSYDLLEDAESALFRRLAVFASGCTVDAALTVCAEEHTGSDMLDRLASLIQKSLLWTHEESDGEVRVGLLETLREYGLERLAAHEEADLLRRRHACHYLGVAEEAEQALTGPEQGRWLVQLEQEHDNMRLALGWARAHREVEHGLRLGGALWRFWVTHGHLSEGRAWLEEMLTLAGYHGDPPARPRDASAGTAAALAKALHGAGALCMAQGDYTRATAEYRASLALRREIGDRGGIAQTLNSLGLLTREQGDYETATTLYEESVAIYRALDDRWGIATALNNLGGVAYFRGAHGRATALFAESLALQRELGNQRGIASALSNLGNVAQQQGDYAQALALYGESLEMYRTLGDKVGIAHALNNVGAAADDQGDYVRASALYEESLALFRELEDKRGVAGTLDNLGLVLQRQGDLARATLLHEECLALERQRGDKWGMATALHNLGLAAHARQADDRAAGLFAESLALFQDVGHVPGAISAIEGLARIAYARGEIERAARLCGAVAVQRTAIGVPLPPAEHAMFENLVAAAREALGAVAWREAHAAGEAITLADAAGEALRLAVGNADERAAYISADHPCAV